MSSASGSQLFLPLRHPNSQPYAYGGDMYKTLRSSDRPGSSPFRHILPLPFRHILVGTEQRLLVQSICVTCGASKLVSVHNGSLHQWENGHQCESKAKAS